MQFTKPALDSMHTESDVEQKFIYPLLTSDEPSGLGHDGANIQTKANLRRLSIDKGPNRKSYFPDYVITVSGVPITVVEAKAPGVDLIEAYREARLYAAELNAQFPADMNPVTRIIATDGHRILAGRSDMANWHFEIPFADVEPFSESMAKFSQEFGHKATLADYNRLLPRLRPQKLWKPRKLVGGVAIQREEVKSNTFGATISADFSHIFNPINHQDRVAIVRDAYIASKRRERYIEPIDRIIRAATPPSVANSKTLEDTAKPTEIIKAFRSGRKLEQQVLLLVGSAGAGKTTFVDYLQEVALPNDVKMRTVWVRINMNPAPISRVEIYDWLRREIIEGLQLSQPAVDFSDIDTIKAIHAPDVNAFRKGIGRLYERDKATYDSKLGDLLGGLISDLNKHAIALARYLTTQSGKLLVLVLDNCDKRLRDEQLLMFEAAQWLQREFTGLVVLPLREETYDNHRDEPPLDTALKDLVFRIEPPLFQSILQSRIQMALRSITKSGDKLLRYDLPNGMYVEYPVSDQAYYLSSIMRSIFEYGLFVRRLIIGLSGRNMRRALEIFLEFCTSGHISEAEFLKIRQSKGQYVLPLALVTTVLLRLNQRFYSSSHAYLKNVYGVDERDARVNYFTRVIILRVLQKQIDAPGPRRLKGYERVAKVRAEVSGYGVEELIFRRELEALARGFCIVSEDFRVEGIGDDDLIALAPAGLVHIDMLGDVYYLAAIAEDTWFFNKDVAERIAARIRDEDTQYTPSSTYYNAYEVLEILSAARLREHSAVAAYRDTTSFDEFTDLTKSLAAVTRYESQIVKAPWFGARLRYPLNSDHSGTIQNVVPFGVFVDLEPGLSALIHASRLDADFETSGTFVKGQTIRVKVVELDHIGRRMSVLPC